MTNDASAPTARQPEPTSPATESERQAPTFTILVPLDGSERAARALPVAEDLCQRLGGEIALIRIPPSTGLPYAVPADNIPTDVYQRMIDEQRRAAREYLERVVAGMRQRGLRAAVQVGYGEPATAIIDAIAAAHASMVVMTTHGRTGLVRAALGSVADRVVREGGVPILLVRSFPEGERQAPLRRALVPLDGSALAEAALFTIGLQLAGPVLREMTLVRVVDPRYVEEETQAAEAYLDQTWRRFVERLGDRKLSVTMRAEVGAPAQGILAAAQAQAADVILMSTHGESGFGRLAFGSVADRLLRDGDLPIVLVCPASGAPGDQE